MKAGNAPLIPASLTWNSSLSGPPAGSSPLRPPGLAEEEDQKNKENRFSGRKSAEKTNPRKQEENPKNMGGGGEKEKEREEPTFSSSLLVRLSSSTWLESNWKEKRKEEGELHQMIGWRKERRLWAPNLTATSPCFILGFFRRGAPPAAAAAGGRVFALASGCSSPLG